MENKKLYFGKDKNGVELFEGDTIVNDNSILDEPAGFKIIFDNKKGRFLFETNFKVGNDFEKYVPFKNVEKQFVKKS
jgi:hypothetical protein